MMSDQRWSQPFEALNAGEVVDFGAEIGAVAAADLAAAAARVRALTGGSCRPQLAALAYAATGHPRALDHYFPLARALRGDERAAFDALVGEIAAHPHFDLRLVGPGRADLTDRWPPDARALAAGHLAETFFYRRDLLARFLAAPRHFRIYATREAFAEDGGEMGGCYHAERETLQLVAARLYEGFGGPWPGVAPFLHELGHMLDFFDAGAGRMRPASSGFLPGMSPGDGAVYTPGAREGFVRGKRLELERYRARYERRAGPDDPLPLGHPYVFQNDTEFVAGYFEMFFRNPHTFAAQNEALFGGLAALFGYDPRRCWPADFMFYVEQNRAFYASGERPWRPGLTVGETP
jgi:hypothetical protein